MIKKETMEEESTLLTALTSPINICLIAICFYLLYKIFRVRSGEDFPSPPEEKELPKMKKQDMNNTQLLQYDGSNADGRICVAVNGKIFDVTRGKRFYGPGAAYGVFAGHDASRGLATFQLDRETIKDEYDDLSDLTDGEREQMMEWQMQFSEKYDYVGRLLKPGEDANDYSDVSDVEGPDKTDPDKDKDA